MESESPAGVRRIVGRNGCQCGTQLSEIALPTHGVERAHYQLRVGVLAEWDRLREHAVGVCVATQHHIGQCELIKREGPARIKHRCLPESSHRLLPLSLPPCDRRQDQLDISAVGHRLAGKLKLLHCQRVLAPAPVMVKPERVACFAKPGLQGKRLLRRRLGRSQPRVGPFWSEPVHAHVHFRQRGRGEREIRVVVQRLSIQRNRQWYLLRHEHDLIVGAIEVGGAAQVQVVGFLAPGRDAGDACNFLW